MSDFEHYWVIIQRMLPRLLLVSLVAALISWVIVNSIEPTYRVNYSYLISLSEREAKEEYRFDGYYALQATDLFAETVAEWVQTPEIIVAALEEADIGEYSRDPRKLIKTVEASQKSAQLVAVEVRQPNEQLAIRLADGLRVVMRNNIDQYHSQGAPALRFKLVETEPLVGVTQLSVSVIVGATFIFTLLLAVNVVLVVESLRKIDN